jgi:agmatine deiminase
VQLPIDDSWLRDSGPIYVVDEVAAQTEGETTADTEGSQAATVLTRTAVSFQFNAWGEKFEPWDRDAAIGGLIAAELGDRLVRVPMVLEGGSVISNGAGTILTTEQCLLNPNRNPSLSLTDIEALLRDHLGASTVIWLGQGLIEDRDTDGHVDLIAVYTSDRRALLQMVPESNPNYENCQENLLRLRGAGVSVAEMPHLPYAEVAGETVAASYMNLYICNGAVIVPVTGAQTDIEALEIIDAEFPEREVVPVPGAVLAYGGGGPHCITQQVPRV